MRLPLLCLLAFALASPAAAQIAGKRDYGSVPTANPFLPTAVSPGRRTARNCATSRTGSTAPANWAASPRARRACLTARRAPSAGWPGFTDATAFRRRSGPSSRRAPPICASSAGPAAAASRPPPAGARAGQAVGPNVVIIALVGGVDMLGQAGAGRRLERAHRHRRPVAADRIPEERRAAHRAEAAPDLLGRTVPGDMLLALHRQRGPGTSVEAKTWPDDLRHCEQWHASGPGSSPATSKRTAPHRHDPRAWSDPFED